MSLADPQAGAPSGFDHFHPRAVQFLHLALEHVQGKYVPHEFYANHCRAGKDERRNFRCPGRGTLSRRQIDSVRIFRI